MVRHGSNPFEYDTQGAFPCHWATGAGNLQGVEALLEVVSSEADCTMLEAMATAREPKEGATPFHWACCGMNTEFVGNGGTYELALC